MLGELTVTTTKNWKTCLAMVFAGTLALTACSGSDGKDGKDGEPGTGGNIPPGVTSGLNVAVTSVTVVGGAVQVRFTLKDDRGYPIDTAGVYSVNTPIQPRFSLSLLSQDSDGNQLPLTVLTQSSSSSSPTTFSPTAYNPAGTPAQGTLVQNGTGAGDYTYTFPSADITAANGAVTKAVAYDPAKLSSTHVVWIQATRQTDLDNTFNILKFTAKDEAYYYVPAGGTAQTREIVTTANCSKCHSDFKPESLDPATENVTFHGGGRIEAPYCAVCHNPGRTSNPDADAMVFVHRIHVSEELHRVTTGTTTKGIQIGGNADGTDKSCSASKPCTCTAANACVPTAFHGIADVTYPQDIRNCNACHGGAAQGDQWKTRPSRAACGSCHDNVDFATGANHPGGVQTSDVGCNAADCHHAPADIAKFHLPLAPPDPNNLFIPITSGQVTAGVQAGVNCTAFAPCTCTVASPCTRAGNGNTNAAFMAAANAVPEGAAAITYDVKSVSRNASKQPVIVFKLKKTLSGTTTDVVFNTCLAPPGTASQELIPGFVGAPSVYFVFALPQDGIAKPADFNASASGYLKTICNGTVSGGAATATIAGPDAEGYYTVTLTGTVVPDSAVMLTGGLGFTYSLSSAMPLTQIDLADYPYDSATKIGGLIVPAPDVYKVATNYSGRRIVVDNAKCNNCHVFMGVNPTFHAGQRNDGPSCAWCHTPNRNSSGWSANSKDIIHDIHGARKRVQDFTWHATAVPTYTGTATSGTQGETLCTVAAPCTCTVTNPCVDNVEDFSGVTFPSRLNNCETCHTSGGFDFTTNASAVPNMLWSTEATYAYPSPFLYLRSPYTNQGPNAFGGTEAANHTDALYGQGYSTSNLSVTYTDGRSVTSGTQTGAGGGANITCTVAAPCVCSVTQPCSVRVKTCTVDAPCQADSNTLVTSPITAACIQCHDRPEVRAHILGTGGGSFYEPRSTAFAKPPEQCLICHGHGTIADISEVHLGR